MNPICDGLHVRHVGRFGTAPAQFHDSILFDVSEQ